MIPFAEGRKVGHVALSNGCWEFTGLKRFGYGRIMWRGENRVAHRVYWEREHGPVPRGMELDHLCRNRACVNPAHLEAVTRAENMRRSPVVTKLTAEQVAEIRRAKGKRRNVDVAREYGVAPGYVSVLQSRRPGLWEEVG